MKGTQSYLIERGESYIDTSVLLDSLLSISLIISVGSLNDESELNGLISYICEWNWVSFDYCCSSFIIKSIIGWLEGYNYYYYYYCPSLPVLIFESRLWATSHPSINPNKPDYY